VYQEFFPLCTGVLGVDLFGVDHHAGRLVMTLTGHERDVTSVAYSQDGRLIASSSKDGTVRIWNIRTGEEATSALHIDNSAVLSIAFSPRDPCIASGTEKGSLCLCYIGVGQVIPRYLIGHSDAILSVAFSSDGYLLASASRDKSVRLWETETAQLYRVFSGHTEQVNVVAFSPADPILASGSDDRTIRIWNTEIGSSLPDICHVYDYPVSCLYFSPDGQKMAVGLDCEVIICKLQTGKKFAMVMTASERIRSANFSPNGQSLVSVHGRIVSVSVPSLFGSKFTSRVHGEHAGDVHSAFFSPDALYIASASSDSTVQIWSTGSGRSEAEPLKRYEGFEPLSVAVSPDGRTIISGSQDGSVNLWDVPTGKKRLPQLQGHTKAVRCVAISSDGDFIASASEDMSLRIWNAKTGGAACKPLRGHESNITDIRFSPDSRRIATCSTENTVRIWDTICLTQKVIWDFMMATRRVPRTISLPSKSFEPSRVGPEEFFEYVDLWRIGTSMVVPEGFPATEGFLSIDFSPNGKQLATSGTDSAVRVWDISSGVEIHDLQGHTARVLSVAYASDSRHVASGSLDGTCRLWDAETGASVASFRGHESWVASVAFVPDSKSIVACGDAKSIRVWTWSDERAVPAPSDGDPAEALASATLNDGWLTGPSGELLVWIPVPYRQYIPEFPCTLVIDSRGIDIKVGSSGWHRGTNWTSCWRQAASSTAQRKS